LARGLVVAGGVEGEVADLFAGGGVDNAVAETVIGLYKTELVRGPGQGPTLAQRG
jgi:hypothetical protein